MGRDRNNTSWRGGVVGDRTALLIVGQKGCGIGGYRQLSQSRAEMMCGGDTEIV